MKYIAEVISTDEIAVWFAEAGYVGEMKDGMYSLVGRVRSPLFPNYVSIEYKNLGKGHFKPQDYEGEIKAFKECGLTPPFSIICFPHFKPSCRLPPFGIMAINGFHLPVEKVELTDVLKDKIKQEFTNNKDIFDGYHSDTRAILIGTL